MENKIRGDLNTQIALNLTIAAVRSIVDAQWQNQEIHLETAQDQIAMALSRIKLARARFAEENNKGESNE